MTNNSDHSLIQKTVELYFKGTYEGNTKILQEAFHEEAHITGHFQGQYYDWSLKQFIERILSFPIPAQTGELYDKKILSLDSTDRAAMVKAKVVVSGHTFIDYITLLKINDKWVIRHKSFNA